MSVFLQPGAKKKIYWYRFMHRGKVIRCSTKQGNYKAALDMENAHKTALAKGDVGIYEKAPAPTLATFAREFLLWAQSEFRAKPKTLAYYANSVARLLPKCNQRLEGFALRAVHLAPHIPDSAWDFGMRCVDAGAYRRA